MLSVFVGCSWDGTVKQKEEDKDTPTVEKAEHITLGLYTKDSFVPYYATTRQNRETLTLCYVGLVALDDTWTATGVLADSWTSVGNTVTVTLKSDAVFSDGTKVTAQDCVYSYDAAKAGTSTYRQYFEKIVSYSAIDEKTFFVTFTDDSIYNVNYLDIPVVKSGTAEQTLAVGAGAYLLKTAPGEETPDDTVKMYVNTRSVLYKDGMPEIIDLALLSSTEDMMYAFNYGGVDVAFNSLASGTLHYRMNTETVTYLSNSFTYAVLNTSREELVYGGKNRIATALTQFIDRDGLTSSVLNGCGTAVWTLFNPAWGKATESLFVNDIYSEDGYVDSFYKGRWYRNSETGFLEYFGNKISLTVIVKGDNAFEKQTAYYLKDKLDAFGVTVNVNVLSEQDYKTACAQSEYDIRIETVDVPRNMNMLDVFAQANVTVSDTLKQAVTDFNVGKLSAVEMNTVFQEELPLIPLYYTYEALSVNTRVTGTFNPASNNMFNGIETWKTEK